MSLWAAQLRDYRTGQNVNQQNDLKAKAKIQDSLLEEEERSRFSFTDYFQKYPQRGPQHDLDNILESGTSKDASDEGPDTEDEKLYTDTLIAHFKPKEKEASTHSSSPREQNAVRTAYSSSIPSSSKSRPSLQDSIYKGTDLDTSLSTIPCEDDKSVTSASTSASTDSISSIEDHAFKQGLAALDANIARMQQQLKVANFAV